MYNGVEYLPARDKERLDKQQTVIKQLMSDGKYRTIFAIAAVTGFPETSISAQLRHLRKARFGSYTVNRRHITRGLFEYQVEPK
jgi:hypothetical protein